VEYELDGILPIQEHVGTLCKLLYAPGNPACYQLRFEHGAELDAKVSNPSFLPLQLLIEALL
jgi:hypothetical protein